MWQTDKTYRHKDQTDRPDRQTEKPDIQTDIQTRKPARLDRQTETQTETDSFVCLSSLSFCIYPAHCCIYRWLEQLLCRCNTHQVVSSANKGIVAWVLLRPFSTKSSILGKAFTTFSRSLIKIKNGVGPSTDPWGTPQLKFFLLDKNSCELTYCCQFKVKCKANPLWHPLIHWIYIF